MADSNNQLHYQGKVYESQVYKTALTDLELETLTSWVSFQEMANESEYIIN